jgi:hypothetical protein
LASTGLEGRLGSAGEAIDGLLSAGLGLFLLLLDLFLALLLGEVLLERVLFVLGQRGGREDRGEAQGHEDGAAERSGAAHRVELSHEGAYPIEKAKLSAGRRLRLGL